MSVDSSLYDFEIPPERIAQRPRPFAQQRLLVYTRATGRISHHLFSDLPSLLQSGDTLILNDSKVIPAKVDLEGWSGHTSSLIFLDPYLFTDERPRLENVHFISGEPLVPQTVLVLPGGCQLTVINVVQVSEEYVEYQGKLDFPQSRPSTLEAYLNAYGQIPLPPYMGRSADHRDDQDYQTTYATTPGSIAAPTAGLHFHPNLMQSLTDRGVEIRKVTLHVGYGTFRSFSTATIEEHRMDPECYSVSRETMQQLWWALHQKRRIIAVGTTSVRTLETVAPILHLRKLPQEAVEGKSQLFIYPPYTFQALSGLITNFHYPRTSVLSLTAAFCGGREILLDTIYPEALEHEYLWLSYGDAMMIL